MAQAQEILPGPLALFLCGMPLDSELALAPLLAELGMSTMPIIYCTPGMLQLTLGESLKGQVEEKPAPPDKLPPVCIFSGMALEKVQAFISGFKNTHLPRPIFATTTVHNLDFTVKELIMHLLEERREQLGK